VKVVVDTNVLVSGLLWHGKPARLLDAMLENKLDLCISDEILAELADVLQRPRLARFVQHKLDVDWICRFIKERSVVVSCSRPIVLRNLRDRDDAHVLAAAQEASADLIITGDEDLLCLITFETIRIVNPSEALQILGLA
jgi:putative PIN family toxin of toxin-antitoxin system